MIDHVLGRPSVTFRKYQVGLAVAFWSAYLLRGNRHGPPGARRLSAFFTKRLTAWQTLVLSLIWLYVARNFGKIVGLECPEPLANLYSKSYFRATYVTTALDAGFWSAMHIRRKWARDLMSVVCSVYYLICAEQADEKVRKIRSVVTIDHLRVAWNKSLTPYLSTVTRLQRPRFMRYQPRAIRIPRPSGSSYTEPVNGWLYFDGTLSSLKRQTKLVLNIPGGGFVAMNPRTHDDSLFAWAGKTGLPILSLDYRKAPEHPYPYALNECFDVYRMIIASHGRCLGLSGEVVPQIVLSGDSAGGNLAAGTTLMILQASSASGRKRHHHEALPKPIGLVLIYPALDVNIGNWLTDEQMSFIRDPKARTTNRRVMRHKSQNFRRLAPTTPLPSDDSDSDLPPRSHRRTSSSSKPSDKTRNPAQGNAVAMQDAVSLNQPLKTRLAVPSLISYVSDRVLTPEMLRAMIILYIGPHSRPDFATDFLLSPVLAPDSLLAQFPKTYFLTGERDPLVDDTVIMAGRIRAAKSRDWHDREEMNMLSHDERRRGWREQDHVNAKLIQGISHGFIQFGSIFPEAWDYIHEVGRWYTELFESADRRSRRELLEQQRELSKNAARGGVKGNNADRHKRTMTGASSGEDEPLEMSSLRLTRKSPPLQAQPNGTSKPDHIDISTSHSFDDSIPPTPYPYTPVPSSPDALRRPKSMVSLGSEDDLLGRRMKGLAGGLTTLRDPTG